MGVENRLAEEEYLRSKALALALKKPARSLGGKHQRKKEVTWTLGKITRQGRWSTIRAYWPAWLLAR